MKIYLAFLVITVSLINCQPNENRQNIKKPTNQIVIGQIDSLYSNTLNESRKIWVHIPESARNGGFGKTKYPVLYLLDGPGHFYSVTGMIKQLSTTNGNTIVPEMVVVAIPNIDRSLDLTPTHVDIDFYSGDSLQYSSGGGDAFLDFMEDELIPYIEKKYPVTTYKTFVGHSFGGLSVINALITRPQLFNNYVAIDPSLWWDNQAFLNLADSILSINSFDQRAMFVGVANTMKEGMKIDDVQNDTTRSTLHIRSILQFVNSMDQKDNGLQFGWKYYDNDNHSSVPLITAYDAFRFLFPWYTFNDINKILAPGPNATAEELVDLVNQHYQIVSDRFGYVVLPPESMVNRLGYGLMGSDKHDQAAAFFDLNIQNYPGSSNVYDSRGDCFLARQDSVKALEYFTKALEVGHNDYSQEKIDILKRALGNQ